MPQGKALNHQGHESNHKGPVKEEKNRSSNVRN